MSEQSTNDAITAAQQALGRALRRLRNQARLTQKQLGEATGAHDTYISQVESGLRDIRWSTITRFLRALDMSVTDLAAAVERQQQPAPATDSGAHASRPST